MNGGRDQPYCTGNSISTLTASNNVTCQIRLPFNLLFTERSRCSHFLSVCYLANAIMHSKKSLAVPCPRGCVMNNKFPFIYSHTTELDLLPGKLKYFKLGQDPRYAFWRSNTFDDEWLLTRFHFQCSWDVLLTRWTCQQLPIPLGFKLYN